VDVLKEEEIIFKETLFGNVSFSREAFHSLNSSTSYFSYHDIFNGLILQESTHYPIQKTLQVRPVLNYLMVVM
jgi:hypothetical protein